jgi:hypothetical protein
VDKNTIDIRKVVKITKERENTSTAITQTTLYAEKTGIVCR